MSKPTSRTSGNNGQAEPPEGDDSQKHHDPSASTDPQDADGGTNTGEETGTDNGSTEDGGSDPESFDDVMASLDEKAQRLVRAKVNAKNNENRNLRRRLNEAQNGQGSRPAGQDGQDNGDGQNGPDAQQISERERRAAEREQKANRRLVHAEIRSLAVDRFADPSDAPAFLGEVEEYLDADGEPDSDSIRSALDDLLDRKPHLAKRPNPPAGGTPRPPAPNPAQGRSQPVKSDGQAGLAEAERRFGKQKAAATH